MAFDWTSVDVSSMATRAKTGGVYRQGARTALLDVENEEYDDEQDPLPVAPVWLRELSEWGFDSLYLESEAEGWLARMEAGHLVLMRHDVFERAECGLSNEGGHRHIRYCAGVPAKLRRRLP